MTDVLRIYCEVIDKSKRKWDLEIFEASYEDQYVDHQAIPKIRLISGFE
jgi:hypothetical protein